MNGVMFTIGFMSTPMYMFFLCYFYLCKVKRKMTDDTFSQKIEWKLHACIIAFNFIVCVAGLVTKTLNSGVRGKFWSFAAVPTGCRQNPEIYGECDETIARNTTILALVVNSGIPFLCLVGITTCMIKICWHVMIATRSTTRKRTVQGSSIDTSFAEAAASSNLKNESTKTAASDTPTTLRAMNNHQHGNRGGCVRVHDKEEFRNEIVTNNEGDKECADHQGIHQIDGQQLHHGKQHAVEPPQRTAPPGPQTYQDESNTTNEDLVKVYRREFVIQANLYVLAYVATNLFSLYSLILLIIMKQQPGDAFSLLGSIFYPLGGLFNILIYTRPQVLTLRRKKPQYSRFQAFVIVIRAGAVVPMVDVEEGNSPSLPGENSPSPSNLRSVRESGQQYLSSEDMLCNPNSIETPPGSLANAVSSGVISNNSEPDDSVQVVERKYMFYQVPLNFRALGSSPSNIANALSPADRTKNSTLADDDQSLDLFISSGMGTIAEEPDEEE